MIYLKSIPVIYRDARNLMRLSRLDSICYVMYVTKMDFVNDR